MRICIVGALTTGIALTVFAGASYAAGHVLGQTGYGAPQVLGEQFIKPASSGSSSNWGLWLGLLVALAILGGTAFFGWRHTRNSEAV
ncbi:MAG: LPXTG cell wall anchor domain-containing protein [Acidimicrobiia bacterium]|nr:LPXTG cell wall anchor domain-containing protein [Acidimicrobiia bacterium]